MQTIELAEQIDVEIMKGLNALTLHQKINILHLIEAFNDHEIESEWATEEEYIAEMERRFEEMENNRDKTFSWEEVVGEIKTSFKAKNL